jgi:hypothetical protein
VLICARDQHVKDQNEELLDETKSLKKQNKKIQRKLVIAVEDRAPLPEDESKRERFVLTNPRTPYDGLLLVHEMGYTDQSSHLGKLAFSGKMSRLS